MAKANTFVPSTACFILNRGRASSYSAATGNMPACVAAAHLLALERPECNFEVFNVGGTQGVTVLEFAHIVAARCGTGLAPVLRGEFRVGDARHTVSDSSKLCRLGWMPRFSVEQIVAEYVEWVRQQRELPDNSDQAAAEMKQHGVLRVAAVHA